MSKKEQIIMNQHTGLKTGKGYSENPEVNVFMTIRNQHGDILTQQQVHNTTTTAGRNGLADRILDAPTLGVPTHMAIGTGTPGATALGVELNRRVFNSKTRNGAVVTIVTNWPAGQGTGALTEAGLFDAGAAGNMWCSVSFAVVNKGASDIFEITWTITIS